jgi:hypothetical protein
MYLNSHGVVATPPKMKENFELPSGEKAPWEKDATTPSAFGVHPSRGGELFSSFGGGIFDILGG